MKTIFLKAAAVLLAITATTSASAQKWTIGGTKAAPITAVFSPDGTLTISGKGEMIDYGSIPWQDEQKDARLRVHIKRVVVGSGITTLAGATTVYTKKKAFLRDALHLSR